MTIDAATAQAFAESLPIDVEPSLAGLAEDQLGQVIACPLGGGAWAMWIRCRPGLDEPTLAVFAEWARPRVFRLANTGDLNVDGGWFELSDGKGWYATCYLQRDAPLDPFLDDGMPT